MFNCRQPPLSGNTCALSASGGWIFSARAGRDFILAVERRVFIDATTGSSGSVGRSEYR
jgi:hypothetical protein